MPQEPSIIGDFAATLSISDVEDLYLWQVVISFNSIELRVIETMSGEFVGTDDLFSFNASLAFKDTLLLADTQRKGFWKR